jgi:hypothetical protein
LAWVPVIVDALLEPSSCAPSLNSWWMLLLEPWGPVPVAVEEAVEPTMPLPLARSPSALLLLLSWFLSVALLESLPLPPLPPPLLCFVWV